MTTYDEVRAALEPIDAPDIAKDEAAAAAHDLLTRRWYSQAEVDAHLARELEAAGVAVDPNRVSVVSWDGATGTITLEVR